MPRSLHILTRPPDGLVEQVIRDQQADVENKVEIVDLTQAAPDYSLLVEKIFAADSVATW